MECKLSSAKRTVSCAHFHFKLFLISVHSSSIPYGSAAEGSSVRLRYDWTWPSDECMITRTEPVTLNLFLYFLKQRPSSIAFKNLCLYLHSFHAHAPIRLHFPALSCSHQLPLSLALLVFLSSIMVTLSAQWPLLSAPPRPLCMTWMRPTDLHYGPGRISSWPFCTKNKSSGRRAQLPACIWSCRQTGQTWTELKDLYYSFQKQKLDPIRAGNTDSIYMQI